MFVYISGDRQKYCTYKQYRDKKALKVCKIRNMGIWMTRSSEAQCDQSVSTYKQDSYSYILIDFHQIQIAIH